LLENETLATRVAAEKAEIARIEAETKKIVTILKEPNKVREIDAEYKLKIAELNAETKVQLSNMKFKGESESARILAEARAYADVKRALVTEKILRNEAKSLEYLSEAENYASSLLTSKREYDRKLKNLSTLKALAESSESGIVISGNELASLQSQMLACI
jgi:regulator of protease activity HflC (stomatin/prohibitin superfamily)